jgi:hypothetical protein
VNCEWLRDSKARLAGDVEAPNTCANLIAPPDLDRRLLFRELALLASSHPGIRTGCDIFRYGTIVEFPPLTPAADIVTVIAEPKEALRPERLCEAHWPDRFM